MRLARYLATEALGAAAVHLTKSGAAVLAR
jgi:hypothetical protein